MYVQMATMSSRGSASDPDGCVVHSSGSVVVLSPSIPPWAQLGLPLVRVRVVVGMTIDKKYIYIYIVLDYCGSQLQI